VSTRTALIAYLWEICGTALLNDQVGVCNCVLVLISGLRRLSDTELDSLLERAFRDPSLDPGAGDP
jgi:hypothetical protein